MDLTKVEKLYVVSNVPEANELLKNGWSLIKITDDNHPLIWLGKFNPERLKDQQQ